jgi:glycerophosphoryl diester phosphodiesterase
MGVFLDTPALCGHRGGGAGEGENTLPSFRAAVAAGLPWVEVDVRLSADGVLVAHHDPVLADGRFVADVAAEDARLLRIDELLDDLPAHVGVDFDLKSALEDALRPAAATTAARLAERAAQESGRRRVLVTSFDAGALLTVRERAPEVPLGLLTMDAFPLRHAVPAAAHLGVAVLAPQLGALRAEPALAHCVTVAHAAGLQVAAWCPRPVDAEELVAADVDCLIVDDVTGDRRRSYAWSTWRSR